VFLELLANVGGVEEVLIGPSADRKTVNNISLVSGRQTEITAGEIVARYGVPCLLMIWEGAAYTASAVLIYPELKVYVNALSRNPYGDSGEYQLQPRSPVVEVMISQVGSLSETCDGRPDRMMVVHSSHWQGFISADLYQSRFRSNRTSP
jgi:hypothetical protein